MKGQTFITFLFIISIFFMLFIIQSVNNKNNNLINNEVNINSISESSLIIYEEIIKGHEGRDRESAKNFCNELHGEWFFLRGEYYGECSLYSPEITKKYCKDFKGSLDSCASPCRGGAEQNYEFCSECEFVCNIE